MGQYTGPNRGVATLLGERSDGGVGIGVPCVRSASLADPTTRREDRHRREGITIGFGRGVPSMSRLRVRVTGLPSDSLDHRGLLRRLRRQQRQAAARGIRMVIVSARRMID